jgi:hypothetical protein
VNDISYHGVGFEFNAIAAIVTLIFRYSIIVTPDPTSQSAIPMPMKNGRIFPIVLYPIFSPRTTSYKIPTPSHGPCFLSQFKKRGGIKLFFFVTIH